LIAGQLAGAGQFKASNELQSLVAIEFPLPKVKYKYHSNTLGNRVFDKDKGNYFEQEWYRYKKNVINDTVAEAAAPDVQYFQTHEKAIWDDPNGVQWIYDRPANISWTFVSTVPDSTPATAVAGLSHPSTQVGYIVQQELPPFLHKPTMDAYHYSRDSQALSQLSHTLKVSGFPKSAHLVYLRAQDVAGKR